MSTDLRTLAKVLRHFHEELDVCINHQDKGGPFHHSDPILLGDFIVDTYNSYLEAARESSDEILIQAMRPINPVDESTVKGIPLDSELVGRDPRLQKMHEVSMATNQLLMVVEGALQNGSGDESSEIDGINVLLNALTSQLDSLQFREPARRSEWHDTLAAALPPLIQKYNALLAVAAETTKDQVLDKLFTPVEFRDGDSPELPFTELGVSVKGLRDYLYKRYLEKRNGG